MRNKKEIIGKIKRDGTEGKLKCPCKCIFEVHKNDMIITKGIEPHYTCPDCRAKIVVKN